MKLLAFCLLLGMSAQAQEPCQFAKLDGVLVDEEPHCAIFNQLFIQQTALDDITRAEFAQAAQRAADETDGKPLGDGPNPPWPPYEPIDVPAVHHKHIIMRNLGTCSNSWAKCIPGRDVTETIWTCADKSRILEHDENSPPVWWCHKVETK